LAHSTLIGTDKPAPPNSSATAPSPPSSPARSPPTPSGAASVTDPLSGTALDYGRTTYHPPTALADHVRARARDQHCRFPHCRRTAADAELDHIEPWTHGGQTTTANLQALCVHHHKLKTHAGWRIQTHPDKRLTWTTPTGHRHTTAPCAPSTPAPTSWPYR
jgi:hypothetical protein